MRPKTDGILESSLYVSDVPRSVRFYQETFGFSVISEFGERGCAMQAGTRQVLLLFKREPRARFHRHTTGRRTTPRVRNPNCGIGQLESLLQKRGIAVEEKRKWEAGGLSLYFRDPDRHLIELATPGTWSVY